MYNSMNIDPDRYIPDMDDYYISPVSKYYVPNSYQSRLTYQQYDYPYSLHTDQYPNPDIYYKSILKNQHTYRYIPQKCIEGFDNNKNQYNKRILIIITLLIVFLILI